MIDLSYIQEQVIMKERTKYLSQHPYKISQGKDGKWRTYLPDADKGRKMIKKSSQKDVEDVIVKYYQSKDGKSNPKTFDDNYKRWRRVQDVLVSHNTITKYNTDYLRYFDKTDFAKQKIDTITEEDIKIFIVTTVKNKQLCKKACKTLFGYIKNTMYSAKINKIIISDPTDRLEAKQFYKYCTDPTPKNRVLSDFDMNELRKQLLEDYRKQPEYIPSYAVHLASLTGMRVGELAALSWTSIMPDYIIIDKSEKYDRVTKKYYIDKTKNSKVRTFPITDEIREVLDAVKRAEIQNGYMSEWVFSNDKGRIHAPIFSSCIKNKCLQAGINPQGIHALRRTINSKLKCNGVPTVVAAALLGHTEQVNEQYYTYDVTTLYDKLKIVDAINKKAI